MQKIAKENPNKTFDAKEVYKIIFEKDDIDLWLGIHGVRMYITGQLTNGSGNLSIKMKDKYDFKSESLMEPLLDGNILKLGINLINNGAFLCQEMDIIKQYYITINFDYCVNCQ